jgi:hypothetical protein
VGIVLGQLGAGVVLTASALGEVFMARKFSRARIDQAWLGQDRDRVGLEVSLFSENLPDTGCDWISLPFCLGLLWLNFCQRLLQVGLKIVNVFDTNGQAH